jgi:isocitrate dehydrogenase
MSIPVTVAYGDGIGPEIMEATLAVLTAAGAPIAPEVVEIGEKVYQRGEMSGMEPAAWESLARTKLFLKAPITTPQGGGYRSLNVAVRAALGLYANIRPCVAYHPFVSTRHPGMDLVIIRENLEDLYVGLEYRQSEDVCHALKIISRSASEQIIQCAFDYAARYGRKKVTCLTKDNILKLTDGLFHQCFEEIAARHPSIESDHWIVDIGFAKVVDAPDRFDLIVVPNLYGDILSDVTAQMAGSVGMAPSSNLGVDGAMFEAIHGSAPRHAGQNRANPSGLLLAAVMMLVHAGAADTASCIHNAWLTTLEQGTHTYDLYREPISKRLVGTREFAQAIIANLGKQPQQLPPVHYHPFPAPKPSPKTASPDERTLIGVDCTLLNRPNPEKLQSLCGPFTLSAIGNRGLRVWPGDRQPACSIDQYRCRFMADTATPQAIIQLLSRLTEAGYDILNTQNLYRYGTSDGFSRESA